MKVIDRLRDDCKTGVIFTNRDPKDITAFMKGYRKDRCTIRIDIVFEDGVRQSTRQFIPHYIKGEVKEKLVQDFLNQDPVVVQKAYSKTIDHDHEFEPMKQHEQCSYMHQYIHIRTLFGKSKNQFEGGSEDGDDMSWSSAYSGGEDENLPDLILPYELTVKEDYKTLYKQNHYMSFFEKTARQPTYAEIKADLTL